MVTDATYELWLSPLRARTVDAGVLVVDAPGQIRTWVADRFGAVLDDAAAAVLGPGARVEMAPDDEAPAPARRGARGGPARTAAPDAPAPPGADRAELNPRLTFEQFVLGDGNRFAHAAALAVAELPAQAYNPLFLYGPPGVGKTHLLHSVGNYVRAYSPGRPSAAPPPRRSPTPSSPRCTAGTSTTSRSASAASTSCSSTTSSSWSPRPGPRRSSSTPSTR